MTQGSLWGWLAVALVALAAPACDRPADDPLPPGDYAPRKADRELAVAADDLERVRAGALRRAKVWRPPAAPIGSADLSRNPGGPDGFAATDVVPCRFVLKSSEGRSPKFQCVLDGGEVVKVKYGRNNPETFGEVAATRLVSALGFGADRVYVVAGVRCQGCPVFPYPKLGIFDALRAEDDRTVDFEMAIIERRMPGLEVGGWSFPELASIEAAAGGASPAEVDALRLLAVFLADWDGKHDNQRILCAESSPPGRCDEPFAYLQDLGQTFGPKSIDLDGWSQTPVWSDPSRCAVSMKDMPWDGSTFEDRTISEAGRVFLAGLLRQLDESQVRGLFAGARFTRFFRNARASDEAAWTRAFMSRVAQIADRPPCPE
jgi:hypothetical protein